MTIKVDNVGVSTSKFAWNQTPTPATDGAQTVFTVPSGQYASGVLEVFLDGLKQTLGTDYTETSNTTFTMAAAPDANEVLIVNYIKGV